MKKAQTTSWERIEAVVKMSEKTVNGFARHIGLPRGENLYQIKRGNNGISLDLANRICQAFPTVSKLWLLTGEGQMLSEIPSVEVESSTEVCPQTITPWVYFAGVALSALITKGVSMPEYSAAHYADQLNDLYKKRLNNER